MLILQEIHSHKRSQSTVDLSFTSVLFAHVGRISAVFWRMASTAANAVTWNEVRGLKDDEHVLLVDVREPKELEETGKIPGAINIPLAAVEDVLQNVAPEEFTAKFNREKPNKDTPIVFSCRSGNRSTKAQNLALNLGYTNVKNYVGGWLDWEKHLKESS